MLKKLFLFISFVIILSSFSCIAAETFEYNGIIYTVDLVAGEDGTSSEIVLIADSYVDSSVNSYPPQNISASEIFSLLRSSNLDIESTAIGSALSALGSSPVTVKKSATMESLAGSSDGYYDENGFFIPPSLDPTWGASTSAPVKKPDEGGIKVMIKETFANIETIVSFPDQKPVLVDGRTLVPARGVFEQLGYQVDWNDETSTALVSGNGITVRIPINSTIIYKNDQAITLDVPAQLIGSRTMLPLRAVSSALGLEVEWVERTSTVIIHLPF